MAFTQRLIHIQYTVFTKWGAFLLLASMGLTSCDDVGRAFTNSGYSYRNSHGFVTKYTGAPENFTDTVSEQRFEGAETLEVSHGLRVQVKPATEGRVLVMGGKDQHGRISVEQKGNTLQIKPSEGMLNTDSFILNQKVAVFTPHVQRIKAHQFSTVYLENPSAPSRLALVVQDHSQVKGSASVETLRANVESHSDLTLEGPFKYADIKGHGHTAIELKGTKPMDSASVDLASHSDATFKGTLENAGIQGKSHSSIELLSLEGNGRASVNLSGHSEATLKGNTHHLQVHMTGHCDLKASDLETRETRIKAASHSDGYLLVRDKLWVNCGSHCDIKVKGDPVIEDQQIDDFGELEVDGQSIGDA